MENIVVIESRAECPSRSDSFWKKANKWKEDEMSKRVVTSILAVALVLGMGSVALADDGGAKAASMWIYFGIAIACGLGIGVAAFGTGLGMGHAINGALQGTARNPEAGGKIMTTMIIGLALIESLCIYALLICFLMVFKLPDLEVIMQHLGG
jgi:F-type H+-transporting ATPase subunit c